MGAKGVRPKGKSPGGWGDSAPRQCASQPGDAARRGAPAWGCATGSGTAPPRRLGRKLSPGRPCSPPGSGPAWSQYERDGFRQEEGGRGRWLGGIRRTHREQALMAVVRQLVRILRHAKVAEELRDQALGRQRVLWQRLRSWGRRRLSWRLSQRGRAAQAGEQRAEAHCAPTDRPLAHSPCPPADIKISLPEPLMQRDKQGKQELRI